MNTDYYKDTLKSILHYLKRKFLVKNIGSNIAIVFTPDGEFKKIVGSETKRMEITEEYYKALVLAYADEILEKKENENKITKVENLMSLKND